MVEHPILGRAEAARMVEIEVAGRRVLAVEGEPVLAALVAEGLVVQHFSARFGEPRGMFCGIGRCTDCMVTVDGRPNVRSCVTPVREGMKVEIQRGVGGELCVPGGGRVSSDFPRFREVDLLVIGAGPAGLSAAITAAQHGAKVLVVDENDRPGGQLFKQIHKFFGDSAHYAGLRGFQIGERLLEEARSAGVEVLLKTVAYGIFPEGVGIAGCDTGTCLVKARRTVLATGANENAIAFPGWTLPGVMTAGAVQTMVNLHRVLPGERVLMVGSGNVGLIVSYQLLQAGARVEAIVEVRPHIGGYEVHAAKLLRVGVPFLTSHTVLRVEGDGRVERAVVGQVGPDGPVPGTEKVLPVDVVCLAVGLSPSLELAQMAGCRLEYKPALGGFVPWHDEDMQTSVPGLYVAGDAAGVEEASIAMEEGRLAGMAAAESLGLVKAEDIKEAVRARLRELRSGPFGRGHGESTASVAHAAPLREGEPLPRGVRRAVIECYQEIPCNPCVAACPRGAISLGPVVTAVPKLDPERCTGCGACVPACPGQAIFVVDTTAAECDRVWLPWEYLPLPSAGQEVVALDRWGRGVCDGRVAKVVCPAAYNRTAVLIVEVPFGFGQRVRGIRR